MIASDEQTMREARYHALLGLAANGADTWEGWEDGQPVGFRFTRGQLRLISEKEQKQLFGRVLVQPSASPEVLPDDHEPVRIESGTVPPDPASPTPDATTRDRGGHDQSGNLLENEILKRIQLDVLGTLPGGIVKVFSMYHRRTEEIRDVGRMTYETLLRIAGPPVKEHVFKTAEAAREAPGGGYTFPDVREAISLQAGYQRIDGQTELGVGVWEGETDPNGEPSVVLVNAGEASYWNGDRKLHFVSHPRAKSKLLDFESGDTSWYRYEELRDMLERIHREPQFAIDTLNETVRLFQGWRWRHETMAPVVTAGLTFCSFVQSIWNYRPQVAVIGPSNSGKSFLWSALERIFGHLCINSAGKATAAGIRQAIRTTSKIVIADEFEKQRDREEILEMLRSSSRGGKILRGTTNQKGQEFRLRHMVWVAAIEVGLTREPDRNRFIMLELMKPAEQMRNKLVLPSPAELAKLGQRILAVAVYSIARAKALAEILKDTRVEGINDRVVESHAVPCAMLAAIHRMNDDEARQMLREVLQEVGKDEPDTIADEQALMGDILAASVNVKGTRRSVGQLLDTAIRDVGTAQDDAIQLLETCGLKMVRLEGRAGTPEGRYLAVAHRIVLEQLLKFSNWSGQSINQILRRIQGSLASKQRIGGHTPRCILIPERYLVDELIGDEARGMAEPALQEAF